MRGCQVAPVGGSIPDHVAASATYLGLLYPGRGLETSIRKEHLDSMTTADYVKVWKVWPPARMLILSALRLG